MKTTVAIIFLLQVSLRFGRFLSLEYCIFLEMFFGIIQEVR